VIRISNHNVQTVIPATAGIQVLNGIARSARDSQNLYAGGSAPAPWMTFLCARKEKSPKESAPGWRDISPCFSPESARAPTRRAHTTRLGLDHGAHDYSDPVCDARAPHTGSKEHLCQRLRWLAQPPVAGAEYRSPIGSFQARPCSSPRRVSQRPASWSSARWGEERRKLSRAPGCVSFGYFWPAPSLARALRARGARPILLPAKLSLHEQRQIRWNRIWTAAGGPKGEGQGWPESKVTCRGSATHKYASPKATPQKG